MIHNRAKLISEIERSIGFKIQNRKHCEILSEIVFIKTGLNISYNTIRRVFKISKGGEPSVKTLNILSVFCGYASYAEFISESRTKNMWDVNQYIYSILKDYPYLAIEKMEKSFDDVNNYLHQLISLIREFALTKQYGLLARCFNSNLTDPKRFNYSEILFFGNCIGDIFQNTQLNILEFTKCKNFRACYFNVYVDYSSLNTNYGVLLDYYNSNYDNDEIKLFTDCLIQLRNYFNCKPLNNIETKLKFEEVHPILYGRLISINTHTSLKPDKIVSGFFDKIRKNKHAIEYLYEFTFFNIITKNFRLIEMTKTYVNKFVVIPQYQEYHYAIFSIVDAILYLNKGVQCNEIMLKLKEMTFFRNSKRDVIELLISILEYHNFSQNAQAYESYKTKSKSLGYKLFDDDYLINFFK